MRTNRGRGAGRASVPIWVAVIALAALMGCSSSPTQLAGAPPKPSAKIRPLPPAVTPTSTKVEEAAGAIAGDGPAGRVRLPNKALTPGAVFSDVREADVCDPRYVESVLPPRFNTKLLAFSSYGVSIHERDSYQVDRLIPVGLGGSNATANLWPQPIAGPQGATQKDALEVKLHALVCLRTLTLGQAQTAIAANWWTAYTKYIGVTPPASGPKPSQSPAALPGSFAVINAGPCPKAGQVGYTTGKNIRLTCQAVAGTLRWGKRH